MDGVKLKELMFSFAKQEFKKAFDFEYNGKDSTPPRVKHDGRKPKTYEKLLQLKSCPATEAEVEEWMNAEGFMYEISFTSFSTVVEVITDETQRKTGTSRVLL